MNEDEKEQEQEFLFPFLSSLLFSFSVLYLNSKNIAKQHTLSLPNYYK